MKTPKKPSYAKGGSLKPVQPGQSGLSKLPTEVRNKMGYMMGGGKLGMMYKNGGKTPIVPGTKKKEVPAHMKSTTKSPAGVQPKKSGGDLTVEKSGALTRTYSNPAVVDNRFYERIDTAGYSKGKAELPYEEGVKVTGGTDFVIKRDIPRQGVPGILNRMNKDKDFENNMRNTKVKKYQKGGKAPIVPDPKKKQVSPMAAKLERAQAMKSEQTFNRNARAAEARNLTEMRNALKSEGPAELAKFDKDLKARGYKVVQKPVKKMAQGGVMKNTKDNNSFISNAVDMSPSTKKQMEALRQAMMYFTGVSPKNK